jgi:hypothetical protein
MSTSYVNVGEKYISCNFNQIFYVIQEIKSNAVSYSVNAISFALSQIPQINRAENIAVVVIHQNG